MSAASPLKIAVVGVGGVGGYFGARLIEAGERVHLIARGAHLIALREGGLRLRAAGALRAFIPAGLAEDPAEVGPCDLVLVCVKAWQLAALLPALAPLVGPQTALVPLQNGVDAPAHLMAAFGAAAAGGTCKIVSALAAPGEVHHLAADPELRVGLLPGAAADDPRHHLLERLCAALTRVGVDARRVSAIERLLWEKLAFIAAYGGVGALTRAPIGVIRGDPGARRLLGRALHEGYTVACALGHDLPHGFVERALAYLDALPPGATTSLQRDILAGRPSELDDWSGAVVRGATRAGARAPIHQLIVDALGPQEQAARGAAPLGC